MDWSGNFGRCKLLNRNIFHVQTSMWQQYSICKPICASSHKPNNLIIPICQLLYSNNYLLSLHAFRFASIIKNSIRFNLPVVGRSRRDFTFTTTRFSVGTLSQEHLDSNALPKALSVDSNILFRGSETTN